MKKENHETWDSLIGANIQGEPTMKNPNHPKAGSMTTVEPIRNAKDVDAIKKLLAGNRRDLLLFTLGINSGLRTGDLLKLKVKDVAGLGIGESIEITEAKTGKRNTLMINKAIHKALMAFLMDAKPGMDDFLFRSRKGDNKPLSVSTVNGMVKAWTRTINLRGNYGAHSLRKTWGYHQRMNGAGFEVICKRFNHASPSVTMRYLGITDREVSDILMTDI